MDINKDRGTPVLGYQAKTKEKLEGIHYIYDGNENYRALQIEMFEFN
jgi:hypothetical protein